MQAGWFYLAGQMQPARGLYPSYGWMIHTA